MINKVISALLAAALTGCAADSTPAYTPEAPQPVAEAPSEQTAPSGAEQIEVYCAWYTEQDVEDLAATLAGECYIWNETDMRSVAITACNRADSPKWKQSTVSAVVRETGFYGIRSGNAPQDVHFRIAREVLDDWSARHSGYDRPWEPWLFFSVGGGGSNVFRTEY